MTDKFAARKSANYKVVSLLPDVCQTPDKKGPPIPYGISIDLGGAAGVSSNVNFNGDPAFLYDQSDTVKVEGDEAGQGKGIKSGTVGAKAEPITSSSSVCINKKQLVREDDLFYMNNKNTVGKLTTSESGGGAHITDEGKITGDILPEDMDEDSLWEKLKGGGKEILNKLMRRNDAIKAQWFAEKGIIDFYDASGAKMSPDAVYNHFNSGNGGLLSPSNPAQQAGAEIVQQTPQIDIAIGLAMAAASRGRSGLKLKGKGGGGGNDRNDGGKSKGDGRKRICKGQIPKGECGEYLIEKHHKGADFEPLDTQSLKNSSGHGIDHAFKGKKGELLFVESKGTAVGGGMPLSKKQKVEGGEEYVDGRIKAMETGLIRGKGWWAAMKGNANFRKKLNRLKEEMKNVQNISYKVCRIQLEDDPTGCYGQRVNKQGRLAMGGKTTGKCKQKIGTEIVCKDWKLE